VRLLLAPAKGPAKLMTAGFSLITNALTRILGAQFLKDLQTFVTALDTVFGGFRQRAQETYALLQARGTAFLVVAAPEGDALREAAYFVERLRGDRMPLAGLIVNRATTPPPGDLSAAGAMAAVERLRRVSVEDGTEDGVHDGAAALTAGLLRLHADRIRLVERERKLRERFAAAHPNVPTAVVPALAGDVHDLDGLREVGRLLAGSCRPRRAQARVASFVRAASSTARHDEFGLRRSSARRSRSVMPPHTPHSIWLSSASARHSVRTGHPAQTCLALFCSAPRTNSSSGSCVRQAAFGAQSSTHMCVPNVPEIGPAVPTTTTPIFLSTNVKARSATAQTHSTQVR
jgi:hypothetical protein